MHKKIKFFIIDFLSKCDQIRKLRSHLLKKSLNAKFLFCGVQSKAITLVSTQVKSIFQIKQKLLKSIREPGTKVLLKNYGI